MNSNLEILLANFSSLASIIALVFIALACRRIRAAGGDKAFGIAALIVFAYLALFGATYLAGWIVYLIGYSLIGLELLAQVGTWSHLCYQITGYLLLLFTAVFAAGCIRSARRLTQKAA